MSSCSCNLPDLATDLEQLIIADPGNRGVKDLQVAGDFFLAVESLLVARTIAITTGMPCFFNDDQKGETDGLPGAVAIAQAVTKLGASAHFIMDDRDYELTVGTLTAARKLGMLSESQLSCIQVLKYSQTKDSFNPSEYDSFVAIERGARALDGRYYSMKGVDLTAHCDPIDDLFEKAAMCPSCCTIGIGDGGNELGLGKVRDCTVRYINLGEKIGAAVAADLVIMCGVSNWAGYAIAAALYAVTKAKHASEGLVEVKQEDFVPTPPQMKGLLEYLNEQGVRDGISGRLDQSVDGLPLTYHIDVVEKIISISSAWFTQARL